MEYKLKSLLDEKNQSEIDYQNTVSPSCDVKLKILEDNSKLIDEKPYQK